MSQKSDENRKESNEEYKNQLVEATVDHSRKLEAFATFNNNKALAKEVHFTRSELKRTRSGKLIEIAKGLHKKAQNNLPELPSYGISADTLGRLMTLIEKYSKSVPATRIAIAAGKQYTWQIEKAIKNAEAALTNIDLSFEIIRLSNKDKYEKYKILRKNVNYGKNSLMMIGKVIDSRIKQPIKNVSLVFKLNNNGNGSITEKQEPIIKKTAKKGGFAIKLLPEGTYTVEISKNGYQSQQQTVAVTNGELTRLKVELVQN